MCNFYDFFYHIILQIKIKPVLKQFYYSSIQITTQPFKIATINQNQGNSYTISSNQLQLLSKQFKEVFLRNENESKVFYTTKIIK